MSVKNRVLTSELRAYVERTVERTSSITSTDYSPNIYFANSKTSSFFISAVRTIAVYSLARTYTLQVMVASQHSALSQNKK